MADIVGCDFGTVHSRMGILKSSEPTLVDFESNDTFLVSALYCKKESEVIGTVALDKRFKSPKDCLFGSKQMLGLPFEHPSVQNSLHLWKTQAHQDGREIVFDLGVKRKGGNITPHYVTSRLFSYMHEQASKRLGKNVAGVVLAYPPDYSVEQMSAFQKAVESARLRVVEMIPEPVAAAIFYQNAFPSDESDILVIDYGASSIKVSILRKEEEKFALVHRWVGLNGLACFFEHLLDEVDKDYQQEFGTPIRDNSPTQFKRVQAFIEAFVLAAPQLSEKRTQWEITLTEDEPYVLTRALFDSVIEKELRIVEPHLKSLIQTAGLTDKIKRVLLVGGGCEIPRVDRFFKELFPTATVLNNKPADAVCNGATLHAKTFLTHKPRAVPPPPPQKMVDFVLLIDSTESMQWMIDSARDYAVHYIEHIKSKYPPETHFFIGAVCFRDPVFQRPDGETALDSEHSLIDFVLDVGQFSQALNKETAHGGGDDPEDWAGAIELALNKLHWHKDSDKLLTILTDAPSHGLDPLIYVVRDPGQPDVTIQSATYYDAEKGRVRKAITELATRDISLGLIAVKSGAYKSMEEAKTIYESANKKRKCEVTHITVDETKPDAGEKLTEAIVRVGIALVTGIQQS